MNVHIMSILLGYNILANMMYNDGDAHFAVIGIGASKGGETWPFWPVS